MFLPAEWHPQALVQLTWPTEQTDWRSTLPEVTDCYLRLAEAISLHEPLLILAHDKSAVQQALNQPQWHGRARQVSILQGPYDDTWARDYGFITALNDNGTALLHDFCFNGWGGKFPARRDNAVNRLLLPHLRQRLRGQYVDEQDFVLEGGSIDTDGQGSLLTTTGCLLHPARNPHRSRPQIEDELLRRLHQQRILWIENGHIEGDDTDGHIDTLCRFCPNDTIVYTACTNPLDPHYDPLNAMAAELHAFRTLSGAPYRLLPLPLPRPILHPLDGHRLPATYANFLVINHAVIMPGYRQPDNDEAAMRQLGMAFPGRRIVMVDATPLIAQHGSIHCATMQFPQG